MDTWAVFHIQSGKVSQFESAYGTSRQATDLANYGVSYIGEVWGRGERSPTQTTLALSQSRATERRRRQSSDDPAHSNRGSPTHPIELGTPASSGENPGNIADAAEATSGRNDGKKTVAQDIDDGSSSGEEHVDTDDLAGHTTDCARSRVTSGFRRRTPVGDLLTPEVLSALPAKTVPRDEWIPGYADRRDFAEVGVAPWPLPAILQLSVRELEIERLFHEFSKPPLYEHDPAGVESGVCRDPADLEDRPPWLPESSLGVEVKPMRSPKPSSKPPTLAQLRPIPLPAGERDPVL
ncbi:unnamed protein product [Phytophthora fragariaefolia]|uniref:Unnamed protein product n=1 Tax=Phytophthora fragariaefolia TaxID=1490495 RepID=A0A9W6Y6I0_9STRA|nr:unnamed protein product [Phytophthora fragariaefolia]